MDIPYELIKEAIMKLMDKSLEKLTPLEIKDFWEELNKEMNKKAKSDNDAVNEKAKSDNEAINERSRSM